MMKTLIISNGNAINENKLKLLMDECDYVICVDGGARHLIHLGVTPDILLGDLDSIDSRSKDWMVKNNTKLIKFPSKKDKTDTELAIDYAIENRAKEIILTGVTGSRLDHTLGNIMLLWRLMTDNIKAKIIDDNNEIFIIDNNIALKKQENTYVSLIPLTKNLTGVDLKGFEYNITDGVLDQFSTMGISNEIIEDSGIIKIKDGVSLVIISRD